MCAVEKHRTNTTSTGTEEDLVTFGLPKNVTLCLSRLRKHARRTRLACFNRTARIPTRVLQELAPSSARGVLETLVKLDGAPVGQLCSLFFFSKSDGFISAVHPRAGTCEGLIQALVIYCILSSEGVTFSVINPRGDWRPGLVPQSNLLSPNFTFEQRRDVGGPAHPFFLQH